MSLLNARQITIIAVVVVTAAIFIAGGIYIYNVLEQARIKKLIEKGRELHHRGKVEESIPLFEEALRGITEEPDRRKVTAKLATDLFLTGRPENQKRAVELIKAEIANEQSSALSRAYFTLDLGSFYFLAPSDEFRRAVIFAGQPYETYLENADFPLAERRIHEYANSFASTAIGKLRVAYWYAQQLMIDPTLTPEQKKSYVETIRSHATEGTNLIERDRPLLDQSRTYQARILALTTRGIGALHGSGEGNEAESGFEELISALEAASGGPTGDIHTYDFTLQARFQYASYLAHAYGVSRAGKIAEVVQPIIDAQHRSSFVGYIRNMAIHRSPTVEKQDHYPSARELALIAKASPEFRDFLNRLGGRF